MPLHLLGKKSWNVYNPENVARVHRDEAEARTREIENEKRTKEVDAEDRLTQLRGSRDDSGGIEPARKRRRLQGENDTDRDIEVARQLQGTAASRGPPRSKDANLQKDGQLQDTMGMRFADAAGRNASSSTPWYSDLSLEHAENQKTVSKDVWGNDDPRRNDRDRRRTELSDPLASMKKGVLQLREAEAHRKAWREQRERDLHEVEDMARKQRRNRRSVRDSEDDGLDEFDLDKGSDNVSQRDIEQRSEDQSPHKQHHHRYRRRHHHHHTIRRKDRSRSPRKADRS